MPSSVFRLRQHLKVLRAVVCLVAVDVVYVLVSADRPAVLLFSDESIPVHVAGLAGVGVIWSPDADPAITIDDAALPCGMGASGHRALAAVGVVRVEAHPSIRCGAPPNNLAAPTSTEGSGATLRASDYAQNSAMIAARFRCAFSEATSGKPALCSALASADPPALTVGEATVTLNDRQPTKRLASEIVRLHNDQFYHADFNPPRDRG